MEHDIRHIAKKSVLMYEGDVDIDCGRSILPHIPSYSHKRSLFLYDVTK